MSETTLALPLVDAAIAYRAAGLSVIAAGAGDDGKSAVLPWKGFQSHIATDIEIGKMFAEPLATKIAVICGKVSGNVECIDFDAAGEAFPEWTELVEAETPGAIGSAVIETTPRGGRHAVYRCPGTVIPGSQKLAMRVPGGGKKESLIETRAEGAYFCAAPSEGYALIQGDLTRIPVITAEQREVFLRVARFLNEEPAQEEYPPQTRAAMPHDAGGHRPGDGYNRRCGMDGMAAMLERHGWKFWRDRPDGNSAWTRPGKDKGISATLREIDGVPVLYVFSSSTSFSPARGYSPFQVFAALEHGGDYAGAAAALGGKGYGMAADNFDTGAFIDAMTREPEEEDGPERIPDPGTFPERLLKVPGFLGGFSEYINRRAVKRQPVLSLGAAVVALGTLTGRKVEGVTGLRTNFYVLGVAETGSGKNTPREMLRQCLAEPGESGGGEYNAVDRLKSDAGIRAALEANPCTTFILDEIGEFLETIKTSKHSSWIRNIIPELMMLYSQAASPKVRMGGLGDAAKNIEVDCPHVCLFGTSVPSSVFQSMTMHSISGGFMGRLMLFESAHGNPRKQRPSAESLPRNIVDAMDRWRRLRPGGGLTGNHAGTVSRPLMVDESAQATAIYDDYENVAREEIDRYGTEWAGPYNRVEENARKLGILYACSENVNAPFIGAAAAEWSCQLSLYLTRRLVYLGSLNIADNETHDRRNKVLRYIVEAGEKGRAKSSLLRRFRTIKPRELGEILDALVGSEEAICMEVKTRTKPRLMFWENNSNNSQIIPKACFTQPDTS